MQTDVPFRAIAEFTYDWESFLDRSGQVRWVNAGITRITGYSVEEGLAMRDYPLPLVLPEDAPIMQRVLERALAGESGNHVEFRVLQKDGVARWTAISWQPLRGPGGESLGVRTSVRDIDVHKQLEQELESALQRAEAASHAKVEFLANVSHELRTPLVSVLGYTALLRSASQDPKQKRYLATIASQGRQLERLVSDLLDFSTLSAGSLPIRPAPVRPDEVVREALRGLLPRAQEKGLDLRPDIQRSALVSLDAARLTQVVSSLIDNAIKFTSVGHITVQSQRDESRGRLEVTVADTGPGLPTGLSLFEPFRQGSDAKGGVGLGLAIAQRLCRAMGGDLTFESEREAGACFRASFLAPLVAAAGDPNCDPEGSGGSSQLARAFPLDILIVDDVASAREFLADALRSFGYEPRICETGADAIWQAKTRAPDVMLIDLRMPGRDGWSVARDLRRLLGPGHVLVGVSASHLLADSPGLAAAGFDAFLPKPTPLAALEDLLRRAATQRQLGPGAEDAPAARGSVRFDPAQGLVVELAPERLAELSALTMPDGTRLLTRTLRHVARELSPLTERVRAARLGALDLTHAVHDLGGLFALLGVKAARKLALGLEEQFAVAQKTEREIESLLELAEQLRFRVEAELQSSPDAVTPPAKKS